MNIKYPAVYFNISFFICFLYGCSFNQVDALFLHVELDEAVSCENLRCVRYKFPVTLIAGSWDRLVCGECGDILGDSEPSEEQLEREAGRFLGA